MTRRIILGIFTLSVPYLVYRGLILVDTWGSQIGTHDLKLDYCIGLTAGLALGASILVFPKKDRQDLFILWAIRCAVTLGLMLLYENSYSLDAFFYFREGRIYDLGRTSGSAGFNGTNIILGISGILKMLGIESYHAMKVIFSFVGFIGSYLIFASWRLLRPEASIKWLYCISLFPSVLFWSSILGKDPLIFFSLALYIYGLAIYLTRRAVLGLGLSILGIALCTTLRLWMSPILAIPYLVFFISTGKTWKDRLFPAIVAIGLVWASITQFLEKFRIEALEDLLDRTNAISKNWAKGGSAQQVPDFSSWTDVLQFLPNGMFTALFRPLPGEVLNPFGMIAGFENLVLLIWFSFSLWWIRKVWLKNAVIFWLLLTLVLWSGIYAFVSYQNLGSSFRFRTQAMPFLLSLIFMATAQRKNSSIFKTPSSQIN